MKNIVFSWIHGILTRISTRISDYKNFKTEQKQNWIRIGSGVKLPNQIFRFKQKNFPKNKEQINEFLKNKWLPLEKTGTLHIQRRYKILSTVLVQSKGKLLCIFPLMTSRELQFAPLRHRQLPNPKSICSAGYTNTVWDPQKWGQKSSTVNNLNTQNWFGADWIHGPG